MYFCMHLPVLLKKNKKKKTWLHGLRPCACRLVTWFAPVRRRARIAWLPGLRPRARVAWLHGLPSPSPTACGRWFKGCTEVVGDC